jgi:hypothetical protein
MTNHQDSAPLQEPITPSPTLTAEELARQLAESAQQPTPNSSQAPSILLPVRTALATGIEDLIELLNTKYASPGGEEYYEDYLDWFGDLDDRCRIKIPDDITMNEGAVKAILTLLKVTGSSSWISSTPTPAAIPGPVVFTTAKRLAWAGIHWIWVRYLVVHLQPDYSDEEAERQLPAVIEYISDDRNHVELSPEVLSLF